MFADVGGAFQHAGPATLARNFHQAKRGDLAHLNAGAVVLEAVLQLLFDGPVVLGLVHIDEVDDHQTGKVAQTQLACSLFGRFHVGLEGRRLDIALAGRLARIDVYSHQSFGLVDDQIAARLQGNDGRIDSRQLILDLVLDEQGRGFAVGHDLLGLRRHQHPHEFFGLAVARFALDPDALKLLVVHVADGAFDQIFFFVDQGWRDRMQGHIADIFPQAQQIFIVALDLGLGALGTGRADDQAHALRHV